MNGVQLGVARYIPLVFCLGNDQAGQELLPEDLLSGWVLMRIKTMQEAEIQSGVVKA